MQILLRQVAMPVAFQSRQAACKFERCKLSCGVRTNMITKRNLQTRYKNFTAKSDIKVHDLPLPDTNEYHVNLTNLGSSRQKINVDGMMLNWDTAGTGDQVILMLPGILGNS